MQVNRTCVYHNYVHALVYMLVYMLPEWFLTRVSASFYNIHLLANTKTKDLLIWIALIYTTLFSGIIFGYSSLQLLLEGDGVLSGDCDALGAADNTCRSRDLQFKLIYTVSTSVFMTGAFIAGIVVDVCGPTVSSILTTSLVSSGFLLLSFAGNDQFDLFMLGGICLGFGGSFAMLNSFPLGFLVEPNKMSFIFTAINCLFDSSGVFFFFCYLLYANTGVGRFTLFLGCACLAGGLGMLMTALWWVMEPELHRRNLVVSADATGESSVTKSPDLSAMNIDDSMDSKDAIESVRKGLELTDIFIPTAAVDVMGNDSELVVAVDRVSLDVEAPGGGKDLVRGVNSSASRQSSSEDAPWYTHISSPKFAFVVAYASLQVLRTNTFFGYVKNVLESMGDADTGHLYTQIFIAGLPCSFIFIPLIEYTNARLTVLQSFRLITLIGYLYGIGALVPVLPLQIVTFMSFYLFRAYIYSMMGFYFAYCFGPKHSGRLYGTMTLMASLVNLLQYPAYYLLNAYRLPLLYLSLFLLFLNGCCSLLVRELLTPLQDSLAAAASSVE